MPIPKSGNQILAWLNQITSAYSTVDHLLLIINVTWTWRNNTQIQSLISYLCHLRVSAMVSHDPIPSKLQCNLLSSQLIFYNQSYALGVNFCTVIDRKKLLAVLKFGKQSTLG